VDPNIDQSSEVVNAQMNPVEEASMFIKTSLRRPKRITKKKNRNGSLDNVAD